MCIAVCLSPNPWGVCTPAVLYRTMLYSTLCSAVATLFGYRVLGRLLGLLFTAAAVATLVQVCEEALAVAPRAGFGCAQPLKEDLDLFIYTAFLNRSLAPPVVPTRVVDGEAQRRGLRARLRPPRPPPAAPLRLPPPTPRRPACHPGRSSSGRTRVRDRAHALRLAAIGSKAPARRDR